jgi:hypothetical protein
MLVQQSVVSKDGVAQYRQYLSYSIVYREVLGVHTHGIEAAQNWALAGITGIAFQAVDNMMTVS